MKTHCLLLGCLWLLCSSCLKEDQKIPFTTNEPIILDDGWSVSSPSREGMDESALSRLYDSIHSDEGLWQIRSLLVFKNDKLIAESYMRDPRDITHPAAIWSCTKQVLGVLVGIALDKGYLMSVEDEISQYLPSVSGYSDKASITLDDLLTMRSGIHFENDGANGNSAQLLKQLPANSIDYIVGLDISHPHGTFFRYSDGDPQLVSAILQKQTGKTLKDWSEEVLFAKLGINNWDWITYKDGITMGAFGILMTPRNLAKIGQLVLNNGIWKGERVVSEGWITHMTTARVAPELTGQGSAFGCYWWIDVDRDIIFMYGHGGQYVFIDRARSLIAVITAEPNTQGDFMLSLHKGLDIFDRIAELIR